MRPRWLWRKPIHRAVMMDHDRVEMGISKVQWVWHFWGFSWGPWGIGVVRRAPERALRPGGGK